jgi:hypothetical protein
MTNVRVLLVSCTMVLAAFAQDSSTSRIAPIEAKNHIGQPVTVCGKVVQTKISKYGLAGHGKPVTFYLDQPEPDSVFYFVAFGSKDDGPQEAVSAYDGKRVCVTGQVDQVSGKVFIMASDRSQIKPDTPAK